MMSRPSLRTQRRYGVSFSVENFFASSSETMASFAMPISPRLVLIGGTLISSRHIGRDSNAFVHFHAQIDLMAGRRAQRRMSLRLQHDIADLDLEIHVVAEEIPGLDRALANVVTFGGRRSRLRQFHILRPHRDDDRGILADCSARPRLPLAHG